MYYIPWVMPWIHNKWSIISSAYFTFHAHGIPDTKPLILGWQSYTCPEKIHGLGTNIVLKLCSKKLTLN